MSHASEPSGILTVKCGVIGYFSSLSIPFLLAAFIQVNTAQGPDFSKPWLLEIWGLY